ncbi:MAG: Secretion protein HlyD [Leptospirillum sp. Group IV 'UBA BS']|nr:MAG: Secretion protein HlyD [Leptospirillum sp. Group IV 'UBA BS']
MSLRFFRILFCLILAGLLLPDPRPAEALPDQVRIPPDVVRTLGIETMVVSPGRGVRVIRTNGVVAMIDDRIRYVTPRSIHRLAIFGYVRRVYADTGDLVTRGQVLVTVFSPDYIEAQQEYLQSIRLERISDRSPSTRPFSPKIREAALARLKNLGVVDREIALLEKTGIVHKNLKIRSPISGYVLTKMAVSGQAINSGDRLFVIANLDWVRINAQVYQQDVPFLGLGQTMKVRLPDTGLTLSGRVIYISPVTDPKTRTVTVRGIFFNKPLRLRPGMFLPVRVLVPAGGTGLWIPKKAVFLAGGHPVVFLQEQKDLFRIRRVSVGASEGGLVPVTSGLHPGERLVVRNGFWVKAQFERGK